MCRDFTVVDYVDEITSIIRDGASSQTQNGWPRAQDGAEHSASAGNVELLSERRPGIARPPKNHTSHVGFEESSTTGIETGDNKRSGGMQETS